MHKQQNLWYLCHPHLLHHFCELTHCLAARCRWGCCLCVCLGGAAVGWYADQIFAFFFFFLAALSWWPCGPTGRKPMGRMTQPALCFYSLKSFFLPRRALWAAIIIHYLTPRRLPFGLFHSGYCRFMFTHLSFLTLSLSCSVSPSALFSLTL